MSRKIDIGDTVYVLILSWNQRESFSHEMEEWKVVEIGTGIDRPLRTLRGIAQSLGMRVRWLLAVCAGNGMAKNSPKNKS